MAMTVLTGAGEVFLEAPSNPDPYSTTGTPPLPPIKGGQFRQPSSYFPLSNPLPIFPPPTFNEVPYHMPTRYDYQPSPSTVRDSDFSHNTSSKQPMLQSSSTNRMSYFKQLLFLSFGMLLTGIPLSLVTTYYLRQRVACSVALSPTSTIAAAITTTTPTTISTASWTLPSQCSTYTTINDSTRSVSAGSGGSCDSGLIAGWYRIQGGGTMLATSPVNTNICSTATTAYYNGTIPSSPGTTVYGLSCLNFGGIVCHPVYSGATIGVTNCDGYYVFYLIRTPGCTMRYCTTP